jgi:hypothetical protein
VDVDSHFASEVAAVLDHEREKVAEIERSLGGAGGPRDLEPEDSGVAGIDRSLAVGGVGPEQPERRLLRRVDRLAEAVGEFGSNLARA